MAPEQAHNPAAVDKRADIYAIGVLLFEALCGQRPFAGQTIAELIGAHLFQVAEKPSVLYQRKALPARHIDWRKLDDTIHKVLAKAAGDRFQDCASLRDQLEAAWGHTGQWAEASHGYSSQSIAPTFAAPKLAARWWLIGGAVLALSLGGGGWRWAVRQKSRPVSPSATTLVPTGRAAARLQAALGGGVAERRALVAAVELVHSRVLLPYIEAALRDQAAAVWPAAVPVAAAMGTPSDAVLRELLGQRAVQPAGAVAVDLAAARLRLGAQDAIPLLTAAAAGEAGGPRLRATLALASVGAVSAAVLQKTLERSVGSGTVTPPLRQATLVQLVRMGDAATEKQLRQALQGRPLEPTAPPSRDVLDAADEALVVYARAGQLAAQTRLAQSAQHATVARRLELAVALADAGDARAVELLVPLCRDGTPRIRQRAAGALGSLGAAGAAGGAALTRLLDDADPGVALTASAALLAVSPVAPATASAFPGAALRGSHVG